MDKQIINRFYTLAESSRNIFYSNHHHHGVSKGEFSMLYLIEYLNCQFETVTTAILSEKLHISKPAVSQMINILEEKQYITRESLKIDRRLKSIALTGLGRQKLQEDKEKFLSKINLILDKMGKEDSEEFIHLMERFFDIVKEISCK